MSEVSSITYNTITQEYDVVLDTATTVNQVFETTGTTGLNFTNGVEVLSNGQVSLNQIRVPAGISQFSTNNTNNNVVLLPNRRVLSIGNVYANDAGDPANVQSITNSSNTFTITLLEEHTEDKTYYFSTSSNPSGASFTPSVELVTEQLLISSGIRGFGFPLRSISGTSSPAGLVVPAGTTEVTVDVIATLLNVDRNVSITFGDTEDSFTINVAPAPPASTIDAPFTTPAENLTTTYNYSDHLNALIDGINVLGEHTRFISEIAENSSAENRTLVESIQEQTQSIQEQTQVIQTLLASQGIPIRDVYASLSYSTLVRVLEDDGIDINELISKTNTYLNNARDN